MTEKIYRWVTVVGISLATLFSLIEIAILLHVLMEQSS